jgi:hypothetical protein
VDKLRIDHLLLLVAGFLLLLLCLPGSVEAACGGSSPNRVAASAARQDVMDCVNAAASGDTITVPAGSASWSSPVQLPANKDLTLQGATVVTCSGEDGTANYTCTPGSTTTNISCGGGTCVSINFEASHTVGGFTFRGGDDIISCSSGRANDQKHFRIHHNHLIGPGSWSPTRCFGENNGVHPAGIWDHNRIDGGIAIHSNGSDWQMEEATAQDQIWATQTTLGDSRRIVYVESNHVTGVSTNFMDGNYGCRYVGRFNRVQGSGPWAFEVHGMQGENRGCQRVEVYKNNVTGLGLSEMRGGTGVYFGNTSGQLNLTVDRAEYDEPSGQFGAMRECGSGGASGAAPSGVDQPSPGRLCRDQVGVSHDTVLWTNNGGGGPFGPWSQVARPVYIWSNSNVSVQNQVSERIQPNSEFFCDTGHSSCNNGVRVGPLGSRPGSCSQNQAYWATDEGEWNSKNAGPDGQLYRCTSANQWVLDYVPAQFPHPWTGGGSGGGGGGTPNSAPNAPSALQLN